MSLVHWISLFGRYPKSKTARMNPAVFDLLLLVAGAGFEPATFGLWVSILYRWITSFGLCFSSSLTIFDSKESVEIRLSNLQPLCHLYIMNSIFQQTLHRLPNCWTWTIDFANSPLDCVHTNLSMMQLPSHSHQFGIENPTNFVTTMSITKQSAWGIDVKITTFLGQTSRVIKHEVEHAIISTFRFQLWTQFASKQVVIDPSLSGSIFDLCHRDANCDIAQNRIEVLQEWRQCTPVNQSSLSATSSHPTSFWRNQSSATSPHPKSGTQCVLTVRHFINMPVTTANSLELNSTHSCEKLELSHATYEKSLR